LATAIYSKGRELNMPRGNRTQPGTVRVRGARQHNLKNIDVEIPRDSLVVFTGVSGSGKTSLAFGTLYAEAQRRYFDSVSPYARRLIDQVGVPEVDSIEGLPPAIALQQQRGTPAARSFVGSITMISNSLRLLYSRAGHYPKGLAHLEAEAFSPNTPAGACPRCHGMGRIYDATEQSMVPDDTLTIRERAIAAWPPAWHGQNLRDILVSMGYNVDRPWRELPRKDRDWILFTEEQPTVPVYAGLTPAETRRARARKEEPSYQGTFTSARRFVLNTFATTDSALIKKRVSRYLVSTTCPVCRGRRLRPESLRVKFAGLDISELSALPIQRMREIVANAIDGSNRELAGLEKLHPEQALVTRRLGADVIGRIEVLESLGLGYLALDRNTPTLSPGELQRLRLATQIRSNLFGVVYVLDEPSAGLHPADTESLLRALAQLKSAGNSVFVVEHEVDVIRHADWVVDIGPGPGEQGGRVLYSGPVAGLADEPDSITRRYLFETTHATRNPARSPHGWIRMRDASRNNLDKVDVDFPLGVLTAVSGISGSGKSTLVGQLLLELVAKHLGHEPEDESEVGEGEALQQISPVTRAGRIVAGLEGIRRLVRVDQKPIGRTPRSNLATYTGLFDGVRRLFAATPAARSRRYDAGRFSFNVAKGRCPACEGEGVVSVELIFLASVFAPCPKCHGARYNPQTLEVRYRGKNIADVLAMTVAQAGEFFAEAPQVFRSLTVLRDVGVGYLRLGQPATELSGGEAQRIKLATELQRLQHGDALYVLDEPTTGLHPADVEKLMTQLNMLVDAGNTVIVVEHDLNVIGHCDWVIDMGPGAGDQGGRVVAVGTPAEIAQRPDSRTASYLAKYLSEGSAP
jgi:excinuclease ABC subunit A